MKPQILFISTYTELTHMAKKLSTELSIPMEIHEGGFTKGGHLYAKENEQNFDVIISYGGTASTIKELVKIPVISIQPSISDIVHAFTKAVCLKKDIAIISYDYDEFQEFKHLTTLIQNVNFKIYSYKNNIEFENAIATAAKITRPTLVGIGNCVREWARKENLDFVLIKPKEKAVREAIISAKNIINIANKDKLHTRRLKNIINYISEGIIFINSQGNIVEYNKVAERLLEINAQEVLSKNINDASLPKKLKQCYGDGSFVTDALLDIDGTHYIINRLLTTVPSQYAETIITIVKVSNIQKIEYQTRMQLHAKGFIAKHTFKDLIGNSNSLKKTISTAMKYSKTSATILIEGETGTGKELFAQSIHNASPRRHGPFIAVNCAALPSDLLESELFGYEEGAFTGSKKGGKQGLFELAHKGTIFLDEIGEISKSLQSKLLRVLQEKELMRLGGSKIIHIDVRVIAATNRSLYKLMTKNEFRPDLYFRLSILNIFIAPLRERPEDISTLVHHIILKLNEKYNTTISEISSDGLEVLKSYSYPGNVRELENILEKLVILTPNTIIQKDLVEFVLEPYLKESLPVTTNTITVKIDTLNSMIIQIIQSLEKTTPLTKQALAKKLGISRVTLWNYLKEGGVTSDHSSNLH